MNLKTKRKNISGIMIRQRRRYIIEKSSNSPIIYQDSKEPELLQTILTEKTYGLAFNDEQKRYIFSNEEGHEVIYSCQNRHNQAIRPMTKKEFEKIKEKMTEKAKTSLKKEEIMAEIQKLNYAQGHTNAVFDVITYASTANNIHSLAININFSRYIYDLENKKLIMVDTSRQNQTTQITDESKKNEITQKMFASKTLQKKINEAHQKGIVK